MAAAEPKDLSGRVILVTGANTGIGRSTAEILARRGARVWLASRSEEKTRPVVDGIRTAGGDAEFLSLDLGDLASVHVAADTFLASGNRLDVLLNNAGVAGQRGITKQGFELHFGTNHLGHFLLTTLLLDKLVASAPARIVNVSSKSHYDAPGIDFERLRESTPTITGLREYAVSKLANILFTKELARRVAGQRITTYALHPGVVASDAWRRIPQPVRWFMTRSMISNDEGAQTSLYCATSPDCASETGLYYDRSRVKAPSAIAEDTALAEKLWAESERWIA